MPSKTEEYLALAQRTANGLTRYWESWTDYLTTASRLYKYPFADQLMIYAQRPDATACADYDIWNNRMNRYVRRGSKGIALLDTIYQIVDLLVDTCTTNRKMLRIAGDDKPAEVVRSRFMKLNADHIRFVLKCLAENSSPIRNMKQYLLASLYNAPTTMQLFYQNQTNHDLAMRRLTIKSQAPK